MSLIPKKLSEERKAQILEELLKGTPSPTSDFSSAGTLYRDVKFEPRALYDGSDKKLLTYDTSLADLKKRGQVRHPRPQEVFSLLIANLENKLTPEQKSVADDMLKSYGEWLSVAAERRGDTLTIYTDPEGLAWDGSKYVKQNFKYDSKKEFSVAGIPSGQSVDLNRAGSDLVEFLYTQKFEQLPQIMREGGKRAQLYLPPDGQIRPVGRGNFFSFCFIYINRASRGVDCSGILRVFYKHENLQRGSFVSANSEIVLFIMRSSISCSRFLSRDLSTIAMPADLGKEHCWHYNVLIYLSEK